MSLLPIASLWDEKSRLNVESDLEFNGATKHILPPVDNRFAFGTGGWAISFILDTEVPASTLYIFDILEGTQQIYFTIGVTTMAFLVHNTDDFTSMQNPYKHFGSKVNVVLQFDGTTYKGYFNTIEDLSLTSTNPGLTTWDFTSSAVLSIGGRSTGISGLDASISQFTWFNRALTSQERAYIHTQGGLLPESTHENCVAHYPLTQRQYFKASADFIVKHPQFALNDKIALDVVEQYNYAKLTNSISPLVSAFTLGVPWIDNAGDLEFSGASTDFSKTAQYTFVHNEFIGVAPKFIRIEFDVTVEFDGVNGITLLSSNTGNFFPTLTNIKTVGSYVHDVVLTDLDQVSFDREVLLFVDPQYSTSNLSENSQGKINNIKLTAYSTLTANHGELINFTDAEVGADEAYTQTAIKDFYNKSDLLKVGMYSPIWQHGYLSEFDLNTIGWTVGQDYTWLVTFTNLSDPSNGIGKSNSALCSFGRNVSGHQIAIIDGTNSLALGTSSDGALYGQIFLPVHFLKVGEKYSVASRFESATTTYHIYIYRHSTEEMITSSKVEVAWFWSNIERIYTIAQTSGVGNNGRLIQENIIYDTFISEANILNYFSTLEIPSSPWSHYRFNRENIQDTLNENLLDLSGNNRNLVAIATPNLVETLEVDSLLPEISKGLRFVGASDHRLEQNVVNIDPNADFYTFMVIHKMADGQDYVGFDDTFYYAHDGTPSNSWRINGRASEGFQNSITEGDVGNSHLWLSSPTKPDKLQVSFIIVNQALSASGSSNSDRYISDGHEIISAGSSAGAKIRFDLYTKVVYGNNAFGGASASYDGYLAAIGIWNRGLSLKEMKALTNNTLFMNPSGSIKEGLQQYNLFNKQTANGIEDLSGNGNHIDTFFNYSVNELDSAHVDYKFEDINELR